MPRNDGLYGDERRLAHLMDAPTVIDCARWYPALALAEDLRVQRGSARDQLTAKDDLSPWPSTGRHSWERRGTFTRADCTGGRMFCEYAGAEAEVNRRIASGPSYLPMTGSIRLPETLRQEHIYCGAQFPFPAFPINIISGSDGYCYTILRNYLDAYCPDQDMYADQRYADPSRYETLIATLTLQRVQITQVGYRGASTLGRFTRLVSLFVDDALLQNQADRPRIGMNTEFTAGLMSADDRDRLISRMPGPWSDGGENLNAYPAGTLSTYAFDESLHVMGRPPWLSSSRGDVRTQRCSVIGSVIAEINRLRFEMDEVLATREFRMADLHAALACSPQLIRLRSMDASVEPAYMNELAWMVHSRSGVAQAINAVGWLAASILESDERMPAFMRFPGAVGAPFTVENVPPDFLNFQAIHWVYLCQRRALGWGEEGLDQDSRNHVCTPDEYRFRVQQLNEQALTRAARSDHTFTDMETQMAQEMLGSYGRARELVKQAMEFLEMHSHDTRTSIANIGRRFDDWNPDRDKSQVSQAWDRLFGESERVYQLVTQLLERHDAEIRRATWYHSAFASFEGAMAIAANDTSLADRIPTVYTDEKRRRMYPRPVPVGHARDSQPGYVTTEPTRTRQPRRAQVDAMGHPMRRSLQGGRVDLVYVPGGAYQRPGPHSSAMSASVNRLMVAENPFPMLPAGFWSPALPSWMRYAMAAVAVPDDPRGERLMAPVLRAMASLHGALFSTSVTVPDPINMTAEQRIEFSVVQRARDDAIGARTRTMLALAIGDDAVAGHVGDGIMAGGAGQSGGPQMDQARFEQQVGRDQRTGYGWTLGNRLRLRPVGPVMFDAAHGEQFVAAPPMSVPDREVAGYRLASGQPTSTLPVPGSYCAECGFQPLNGRPVHLRTCMYVRETREMPRSRYHNTSDSSSEGINPPGVLDEGVYRRNEVDRYGGIDDDTDPEMPQANVEEMSSESESESEEQPTGSNEDLADHIFSEIIATLPKGLPLINPWSALLPYFSSDARVRGAQMVRALVHAREMASIGTRVKCTHWREPMFRGYRAAGTGTPMEMRATPARHTGLAQDGGCLRNVPLNDMPVAIPPKTWTPPTRRAPTRTVKLCLVQGAVACPCLCARYCTRVCAINDTSVHVKSAGHVRYLLLMRQFNGIDAIVQMILCHLRRMRGYSDYERDRFFLDY